VGIEATFPAHWFERLMGELGHELWVGDAARIRPVKYAIRRRTPAMRAPAGSAAHGTLPARLGAHLGGARSAAVAGAPDEAGTDADAGKEPVARAGDQPGVCRKGKLWSVKGRKELESLALLPWAARRRKELLESLDRLDEQVRSWTGRWKKPAARLDPQLRRTYQRLKKQKASGVAKVAVARRLAVRLFWMLRTRHNYTQLVHMSAARVARWFARSEPNL